MNSEADALHREIFGDADMSGAVDPEIITASIGAGVQLLGLGVQALSAGSSRKAQEKAAREAAKQSEADAKAAAKQAEADAKRLAAEARIAEAQAAANQRKWLILGGVGIFAILTGGGLFYAYKVKK